MARYTVNTMPDDIYKKIFGSVKKGINYSSKDKFGGGYNSSSLRSSMEKFRNVIYGGQAGRNLSKANADAIIAVIEPHLKHLPLGGRLSYLTKVSIRQQLWQMVLSGELTREDFKDAKRILALF